MSSVINNYYIIILMHVMMSMSFLFVIRTACFIYW